MIDRVNTLLSVLCITLSAGCAPEHQRTEVQQSLNYQTVPAEVAKNTELAQQHYAKALKFIEQGLWEKAEASLKLALEADVEIGPAHNNLGKLYLDQGKYYLAAWEFKYAIKLMPHAYEPQNNLGLVFEHVGKLNEAIEQYITALELSSEHHEPLANLTRARIRRGDHGKPIIDLLGKVALKDPRPQWVQWARKELGRRGVPLLEDANQ